MRIAQFLIAALVCLSLSPAVYATQFSPTVEIMPAFSIDPASGLVDMNWGGTLEDYEGNSSTAFRSWMTNQNVAIRYIPVPMYRIGTVYESQGDSDGNCGSIQDLANPSDMSNYTAGDLSCVFGSVAINQINPQAPDDGLDLHLLVTWQDLISSPISLSQPTEDYVIKSTANPRVFPRVIVDEVQAYPYPSQYFGAHITTANNPQAVTLTLKNYLGKVIQTMSCSVLHNAFTCP